MLATTAVFVFLSLTCLGAGVLSRSTASQVAWYFEGGRKPDTRPFFDSLWSFTRAGMGAEDALKLSALFCALGVGAGLFLQGAAAAVLLGSLAFVGGPRLYMNSRVAGFKKKFEAQLPRALASFSAAARVMPLKACFRQVAKEFQPPVGTVFSYIAGAVEMDPRAYAAVSKAAEEFDLPVLHDFAESVRALEELGGGEGAAQLLDAVAEEARFKQRHRLEVKGMFGELQYTMLAACGVPVFMFALFALDSGSEYRAAIVEMPWLIALGVVVLLVGWGAARSFISSASRTV